MTDIRARIRVDPDHRISGAALAAVPPGEHEGTITVARVQRAGRAASRRRLGNSRCALGRQHLAPPRGYVWRRWPL